MANFFSVEYWKALYFKAMGGQATAADPNAMSGTFAGSSAFSGTLSEVSTGDADDGADGGKPKKRKKRIYRPEDLIPGKSVLQQVADYFANKDKPAKPKPKPKAKAPEIVEAKVSDELTPDERAALEEASYLTNDEEEEIIVLLLAA